VLGIDNFSKSYDVKLKKLRITELKKYKNFDFYPLDILNLTKLKLNFKIDTIIHLAAEAGVRKSIDDPYLYVEKNISGTIAVFEYAKKKRIKKIYYASSSSIYGDKGIYPTNENVAANQPISIYGLTKIATENIAHYYYKIFSINSIGFRFFTVYGPYGRPDMSIFIFAKSILMNKPVYLNNFGNNLRDYTYVGDVINYIFEILKKTSKKRYFFEVFNIGGEFNIKLTKLIKILEKKLKKKSKIIYRKKIPLDPVNSLATSKKINKFVNKKFNIGLNKGLDITLDWLVNYLKK